MLSFTNQALLNLLTELNIFFFFFVNLFLLLIYLLSNYTSAHGYSHVNYTVNNYIKNLAIVCANIFFFFNIIGFYYFNQLLNIKLSSFAATHFNLNSSFYFYFLNFKLSLNFFGYIIFFLAFVVGFISILTLDTRIHAFKTNFFLYFNFFLLIVFFFVSTNNLFFFFFFYELLLLPSFLFVFYISYTRKAIQASIYFVIWTQAGSLLVLVSILYMYAIVGSLDFFFIKHFLFKKNEAYILYTLLFLGFGIKVPIWPFHYWLTKTHVEAPSGFSIYLSGFLVKSALFGFFKITSLINFEINTVIFCMIAFIGGLDASFKMWGQSDLKKLVAYCTIQEMNLIFFLFLVGDTNFTNLGILFTVTHAFLSILMFFLVDCIYRRFHTRSIYNLSGLLIETPNLAICIVAMVIFFSGLPGTLKFICEFYIFFNISSYSWILSFFFMFCFNFIGLVGFSKSWFNAIFMLPKTGRKSPVNDLTKKEFLIIFICFFFLIFFSYFSNFLF